MSEERTTFNVGEELYARMLERAESPRKVAKEFSSVFDAGYKAYSNKLTKLDWKRGKVKTVKLAPPVGEICAKIAEEHDRSASYVLVYICLLGLSELEQ